MTQPAETTEEHEDGRSDEDAPSLSGEIRSGTLCKVVAFIGQEELAGELRVETNGKTRSIFFDGAQVVAPSRTRRRMASARSSSTSATARPSIR